MNAGNLHLLFGNHLETLAVALARLLRAEQTAGALDPLNPEIVLVQSKGMQRWLTMRIAQINGICANMDFPFPNAFLEMICQQVLDERPDPVHFDPLVMTMKIMGCLGRLSPDNAFIPINQYLSGSGNALKRYQLSSKIADVLDQYMVFRPEMIRRWDTARSTANENDPQRWQRLLWVALNSESGGPHPAQMQRRLVERLKDTRVAVPNLPPRVFVFGISYLPPFHLQVLEALSTRIPVNMFLFNPCRQYWSDIVSERQLIKKRNVALPSGTDMDALHYARGNKLLSAWGMHGRQFFSMLHQMDGQTTELFEDNATSSLLGRIQQDILDLVDRPDDDASGGPQGAVQSDGSIRIHACHSPMREVEVLHDQILDILEHTPDITPSDIMIMTPDITAYAPLIHGVFNDPDHSEQGKIPYTIADQTAVRQSGVVQAFLALLDFADSRFELSTVMALLQFECVRRRFDLEAAHLPLIEKWVDAVQIRWGWDGPDREKHGLPPFSANTWRNGLDRLLLGYAVDLQENHLIFDMLPYQGALEGADCRILGRFMRFVELLQEHMHAIAACTALDHWPNALTALVNRFIAADPQTARDTALLYALIEKVGQMHRHTLGDVPVDLSVMRQLANDDLDRAAYGGGFLTGGITFCAMLPMRSIPAKVIGILGLQHAVFPKDDREPRFNVMADNPKPGDRSKRNDDKYLFLEALLSARRIFYLSYVGRDIQDNAPIPPSVVISELLEYIQDGFDIPEPSMVTEQPLQPFSPRYFDGTDTRLFSYSRENCNAAGCLNIDSAPQPFFEHALPKAGNAFHSIDLATLSEFFAHPIRFLLQRRMGIRLSAIRAPATDREWFQLDALQQFKAKHTIFDTLAANAPDRAFKIVRAAGMLPHGTSAQVTYDRMADDVSAFLQTLDAWTGSAPPKSYDFHYAAPPVTIRGTIDGVHPDRRVQFRMAAMRPQDLIECYIYHLALNLAAPDEWPLHSALICQNGAWSFEPLHDPQNGLNALIDAYIKGLERPLMLLPKSSYAYAYQSIVANKAREKALSAARAQYYGGAFHGGECEDGYLERVLGDQDPFDASFESLALALYEPIFDCATHDVTANA